MASKQRLNTPFLIWVTALAVIGVFAVLFGPRLKQRLTRHPGQATKQLESARTLLAAGQRNEARDAINGAYAMDHTNKEVCLVRGDVFAAFTDLDGPQALETARVCWQSALDIDPQYKPAMERLLDSYVDQMEVAPTTQTFVRMHDAADRVLQAEPGNDRARGYLNISVIQQWVMGAPKGDREVMAAIKVLETLIDKDPAAAEPLYYLVRGKTWKAAQLQRMAQGDTAQDLLDECRTQLDKEVAQHPKDSLVNFRAFQSYLMVAEVEKKPELAKKDQDSADAALKRARAEVKENDQRYADMQYVASEWAARNRRQDEAEHILREFYEKHPTDQRARLALAKLLGRTGDAAKRDEGIKILTQEIVPTGARGPTAPGLRELEAHTLLELANLKIAKAYTVTDVAERQALVNQIDDAARRINSMAAADSIPVLRLRGSIFQLKGQAVEAVGELAKAMTMLEHTGDKSSSFYDLMYQLALANRDAGQNRAARKLLVQLIDRYDGYVPARLQLAQLCLLENDVDGAARQVDRLAQLQPDAPDVIRLQMSVARAARKPEDAKKFYERLPEDKYEAKLAKAQAAAALADTPEVIRLLEAMSKERPDDVGIAIALTQAYTKENRSSNAKAVLDAALQKNPKEPRLVLLQKQMNNASPQEVHDLVNEFALSNADPMGKELIAARQSINEGKLDDALVHVVAADKIRPNDPIVWDAYFNVYRGQRNWELAQKAVDNLVRLDADHAGGRMYRWMLAMGKGDYSDAVAVAHELTDKRQDFGRSWLLLAQALQANGQFTEAIQQYQAALERQSTDVEVYKGMSDCYLALSQPDRARERIAEGLRQFPDNVQLREIAMGMDVTKHPEVVVPVRERMLEENPNEPENYINLASALVYSAQNVYANDPIQAKGFTDRARDVLTKGVSKFPDHLRLNGALAESLQDGGQYDQGLQVMVEFTKTKAWAEKPDALLLLADYYARARQADKAEETLRQAWAMSKNQSFDVQQRIAAYLVQQGKFDQALEVLKVNATDQRVVRLALETHIAAKHTAEAEKGLNDEIAKHPQNTDYLNLLCGVYIDGRRFNDARQMAAHILKLDPRNDVAQYYQALVELRDPSGGDMLMARRNLANIIQHAPRNIQYKLVYADALLRVHDGTAAAIALEDVLKIDPLHREARAKLLDVYTSTRKWSEFEKVVDYAELNNKLNGDALWYRAHAFALAAQQRYREAVDKIKTAISISKESESVTYVRDYLTILQQSKDYQGVTRETMRLIDNGHHEWWIYQARGLARAADGNKDAALEEFVKGLKFASEDKDDEGYQSVILSIASEVSADEAIQRLEPKVNVLNRWALLDVALHMRKMDYTTAIARLEPMIAKAKLTDAERVSAIRYAAECYQATGQPSRSKDYYLQWVGEAPNDMAALNNLAYLLAEDLKVPDEARKYSQTAYDLGRKQGYVDPMIQDTHGWVLTLCKGAYASQGITLLDSVVQDHPDFLEARYHLGIAYLLQKRPLDARAQLQNALDQIHEAEDKNQPVRAELKKGVMRALTDTGQVSSAVVGP